MTFPDPDEWEYMAKHPFVAIEDPNAMVGDYKYTSYARKPFWKRLFARRKRYD